MSNSVAGTKTGRSGSRFAIRREVGSPTIAIAKEADELKAVGLRKRGAVVEVLWTKSDKVSGEDWHLFAAECGLSAETREQKKAGANKIGVVGFGSSSVAFYRVDMPAVGEEETAAMVRMRAETLLPLPVEQMELTWRAGRMQNEEVAVTIAAARRRYLQGFVEHVREFEPTRILLNSEGIVKAWRELFSGNEKDAVIVSLAARNTQVCLAEDGQLSNAVVLDVGMEDLSLAVSTDQPVPDQTQTAERFAQDMRSVLGSFGCAEPAGLPVFVLSNGNSAIESIVSSLSSAGMNVKAALPKVEKLAGQAELGVEGVYEYRVPIGLALMALDRPAESLNLFERLYTGGMAKKRSALYSPKVAGVITAIMLAVLVAVSYAVDVADEKRLGKLEAEAGFKELMQRQTLIKAVARQRPDLLQLLSEINSGDNKGIVLDSFHFKKGQLLTIRGRAQSAEQIYEFQKSLLGKSGIKKVVIQNPTLDSKTKKIKFTLTFHYKNFTKKS